ncbi:hypothetical protein BH24ACT14_BH24ACT14_05520 [soil metagenome]
MALRIAAVYPRNLERSVSRAPPDDDVEMPATSSSGLGCNERRALADSADSAAIAGVAALDEAAFRNPGSVRLDPAAAESLAARSARG